MFEVSLRWWSRVLLITLLFASSQFGPAQERTRKARVRVEPTYPALARKMQIAGTVKVEVTISPSGSVLHPKLVGGNPILAASCMEAVSKWKFESGEQEEKQLVECHFDGR